MKKRLMLGSFAFALIFVLSFSVVSAGVLGNWFTKDSKNLIQDDTQISITGDVADDNNPSTITTNNPSTTTTNYADFTREYIKVFNVGDDTMNIKFIDFRGVTQSFQWAGNAYSLKGSVVGLFVDGNDHNLTVCEGKIFHEKDYVVVGNEDDGYLLKLTTVKNDSSTTSSNTAGDAAEFTDVFSGDLYKTIWTSDGVGSVIIGGKTYSVYLEGDASNATEGYQVHLDYPDSRGNGVVVLFPTIQTSKGAKVAFYQPEELHLKKLGVLGNNYYNVSIMIPDGDGYRSVLLSSGKIKSILAGIPFQFMVGKLSFNITKTS